MDDSAAKSIAFGSIVVGISAADTTLVLQDGNSQLEWDSRAHSGDYFTTLATELENLVSGTKDAGIEIKIQSLIDELEYIQQRYDVTRKHVETSQFDS